MSEGSRLARWSQRKLAARHGGAVPEPVPASPAIDDRDRNAGSADDRPAMALRGDDMAAVGSPRLPSAGAQSPPPDLRPDGETMLTEADLPSIDGLTAQSDYTVFLQKNVPETLRKAALRKLWGSDPVLANLDGLNDYDDDYTVVTAMTMDDTLYRVGRGLLDDVSTLELPPNATLARSDDPGDAVDAETAPTRGAAAAQSLTADAEPAHNVTPDAAPQNDDGYPPDVDADVVVAEGSVTLKTPGDSSSRA